MSAVALAVVGGVTSIGSALIGSSSASDAANAQIQAANTASQTELSMFNQTQANEQPFMTAGQNSLAALMQGLGLTQGSNGAVANGALTAPFNYQASPGYAYEMSQALQATQNSAAARGGLNSGNTDLALQQNAQNLAATDYSNQASLNIAQKNQLYNMLQTIAGSGQNAAANLGALGSQTAQSIGSNTLSAGNASAAGSVAQGNALAGLLNNSQFINGVSGMFSGGGSSYNPTAALQNVGSVGYSDIGGTAALPAIPLTYGG